MQSTRQYDIADSKTTKDTPSTTINSSESRRSEQYTAVTHWSIFVDLFSHKLESLPKNYYAFRLILNKSVPKYDAMKIFRRFHVRWLSVGCEIALVRIDCGGFVSACSLGIITRVLWCPMWLSVPDVWEYILRWFIFPVFKANSRGLFPKINGGTCWFDNKNECLIQ